ncbi:Tryprostatin B 6-hydroxylase [Lachnellula suecica]|uniref:Tryprostatin B 6-hydroxylase n=1 Tax=Lachnellula suecica TaxID=602035 RepID=A0A8T9C1Y6_9HELO|nr:Tryprostatin B 6-hydroxylase [Lachnellula suecica]
MEFLAAGIAGVASHITYFRRGEHHLYGQYYFQGFFVIFTLALALLYFPDQDDLKASFLSVGRLSICYLIGLFSSLVIYRLILDPLNKFPGLVGAKISGLWISFRFRRCDGYKQAQKLHEEYGLFVRVGSSDLSIAHPQAVEALYGPKSKCIKGSYYDLTKPMVSMQTFRDRSQHDARRRIWSAAFSDNAIRGYEKRIKSYQDKMIALLQASDGTPVNITNLLSIYNFDVVGDLAFGKSFDLLENPGSQLHWAVELLREGLKPLAFLFPIWFLRFMTKIPFLARDWWRFIGFCRNRLIQRMKESPDIPDIMSVLLAPLEGHQPSEQEMNLLVGDSQLILGAGRRVLITTITSQIKI